MKWLRRLFIKNKKMHNNNLKCAQNIDILTVTMLSNNRKFRRVMEKDYPQFARAVDAELKNIKN